MKYKCFGKLHFLDPFTRAPSSDANPIHWRTTRFQMIFFFPGIIERKEAAAAAALALIIVVCKVCSGLISSRAHFLRPITPKVGVGGLALVATSRFRESGNGLRGRPTLFGWGLLTLGLPFLETVQISPTEE